MIHRLDIPVTSAWIGAPLNHCPVPCSGTFWFAFAALSKIVSVEFFRPVEAGTNITLILHFFPGRSFLRQVVACAGNPNSCGLVVGTFASGFPKMIGGPLLAGLLSVNLSIFAPPTLTSPKSSVDGLTFSTGTPLGVAVAVGVGVRVDVGVAVEV